MIPALLDIPESFETERLVIRSPRPGDGQALFEAVSETLTALRPWMPWAKDDPSPAKSEENSRLAHAKFLTRDDLTLRLIHKESGLILGSSGLHPREWSVPKFEIGYWCRTRFEGQGYITEAVSGIMRFGFETLGARRLEIRCDAANLRSARVAERVGMRREAELRDDSVSTDGMLRTTLVFGMTRPDWDRAQSMV